jgi:hypothetical protein
MSPCAVEAASELPAEDVLDPQDGFAAAVVAVVAGDVGIDAVVVVFR